MVRTEWSVCLFKNAHPSKEGIPLGELEAASTVVQDHIEKGRHTADFRRSRFVRFALKDMFLNL
jgi:hypothetical protein